MALTESIIGIVGVGLGVAANHFLANWRDRSNPECMLMRLFYSTTVPRSAEDQTVRFPEALVARYNAHATLPGAIDSSKDFQIKRYVELVNAICEKIRMRRGQLEHYNKVLPILFRHLDTSEVVGFCETFSEYNDFLWGYIHGRCKRFETPPHVPDEVADTAAITPKDQRLHLFRDQDGDYVIDIANSVHRILLVYSSEKAQGKKDRAEKAASNLAKDIVEFNVVNLKALLGKIESEVQLHIKELDELYQETLKEKARFSFLAVDTLVRNKGRRPFCVDLDAKLFVRTAGYNCYDEETSSTLTIADDTEIELAISPTDSSSGVVEIPAGSSRVLTFTTRGVLSEIPNYPILRRLAQAGERDCYVGLILYSERSSDKCLYSSESSFSLRTAGPDIAPKGE